MGWFRRQTAKLRRGNRGRRGNPGERAGAPIEDSTVQYLSEFTRTHRGVEAFVEQPTQVTQATLLLIAWDGEWTRRRVPSTDWAHSFAEQLEIPGYDAAVVGYPQRMRDYNRRKNNERRREQS